MTTALQFENPDLQDAAAPHIADHEVLRCIGRGSYGEVWLARSVLGSFRAIKIVRRSTFQDSRPFEREFSGIQKFEPIARSSDGLVHILQTGRNDREGYFYYVMELADDSVAEKSEPPAKGESASTVRINPAAYVPRTLGVEKLRRGKLPAEECLRLGFSLSSALEQLHRNGLIHRDIKPSNIIFVKGAPKLADIGLVTEFTEARSYVGTEGFIPPEGPNSPQADIYSLGKVLYEIAMGKDRQDYPEPASDLVENPDRKLLLELNAIILKACEPDPVRRYKSAGQMHQELALLLAGKSIRERRSRTRRIKALAWSGATAGVLAAAALGMDRLLDWRVRSIQGQSSLIKPSLIGKIKPRDSSAPRETIDLSAYYTAPLIEAWYPGPRENTLISMPKGLQKFAGTTFDTRGLVQLSGDEIQSYGQDRYPREVAGIPIDRWVKSLYFLQGALSEMMDERQIGVYRVKYASGRTAEIPLVYGRDLRALWQPSGSSGVVPNSVVAWTGENPATRERNMALRVYKQTWENPSPNDEIIDLDFQSAMGNSAPFLVALTCEEHEPPPDRKLDAAEIAKMLQSHATSFQRLKPLVASGPCQFTRLKLNQTPLQIGDKYYGGFRFSTPSDAASDLVWAFKDTTNLTFRSWYILPIQGRLKVGFEDWYHGITEINGQKRATSEVILQFLSGKKLQPGREYFIWFTLDDPKPGEIQAAMRFVPAAEINPNSPETLVQAIGFERTSSSPRLRFHRHYCLGAVR
jgi:serine/threonine protein kinase